MDIDSGDEFLTGREVQRLLNISPSTLDRWVKIGRLRPQRLPNGYRRYLRSDVLGLLQSRAAS